MPNPTFTNADLNRSDEYINGKKTGTPIELMGLLEKGYVPSQEEATVAANAEEWKRRRQQPGIYGNGTDPVAEAKKSLGPVSMELDMQNEANRFADTQAINEKQKAVTSNPYLAAGEGFLTSVLQPRNAAVLAGLAAAPLTGGASIPATMALEAAVAGGGYMAGDMAQSGLQDVHAYGANPTNDIGEALTGAGESALTAGLTAGAFRGLGKAKDAVSKAWTARQTAGTPDLLATGINRAAHIPGWIPGVGKIGQAARVAKALGLGAKEAQAAASEAIPAVKAAVAPAASADYFPGGADAWSKMGAQDLMEQGAARTAAKSAPPPEYGPAPDPYHGQKPGIPTQDQADYLSVQQALHQSRPEGRSTTQYGSGRSGMDSLDSPTFAPVPSKDMNSLPGIMHDMAEGYSATPNVEQARAGLLQRAAKDRSDVDALVREQFRPEADQVYADLTNPKPSVAGLLNESPVTAYLGQGEGPAGGVEMSRPTASEALGVGKGKKTAPYASRKGKRVTGPKASDLKPTTDINSVLAQIRAMQVAAGAK